MQKLLLAPLFTLLAAVCCFAQPSRSESTTIQQWYRLPADMKSGPVDIHFTFTYYFQRESIGNDYFMNLVLEAKARPDMPRGDYNFRYEGREYSHNDLSKEDGLIMQGFTDVRLSNAKIMVHVTGGPEAKLLLFESTIGHKQLWKVPKDADPRQFTIQFRDLKSIYYTNETAVVKRIQHLNSITKKREAYKNYVAKGDADFDNKNWGTAKYNYGEASKLFTSETYPKAQLEKIQQEEAKAQAASTASQTTAATAANRTGSGSSTSGSSGSSYPAPQTSTATSGSTAGTGGKPSYPSSRQVGGSSGITNMTETVKVNGEHVKVYQQNGEYYMQRADGSTHVTSKEAYDTVQKANAKNSSNQVAAASQAERGNQTVPVVNHTPNQAQAAPAASTSNSNVPWSEKQVQEYLDKDLAARQVKEEKILRQNAATDVVVESIGNLLLSAASQKREQATNEYLRRVEKEDAEIMRIRAAEIEEQRKKEERRLLTESRREFILNSKFEQMPLSSTKVVHNAVYFFFYSFDPKNLDQHAPNLVVSNVFPLNQYADGTWPNKENFVKEINKTIGGLPILLSGFYTSRAEAERYLVDFKERADKYGFSSKVVAYTGKASHEKTADTDFWGNSKAQEVQKNNSDASDIDFWGNSKEQEAQKSNSDASGNDFWGNSKEQDSQIAYTDAKQKQDVPSGLVDFWGNSVKKEVATMQADASSKIKDKDIPAEVSKKVEKAAPMAKDIQYSEWLFIQSDKALQYRMAKVKQEGDICFVQLQIRLNKEDDIYCRNTDCLGYVWFFSYSPDNGNGITSNIIVKNSYDRIYNYPTLIPILLSKEAGKFELYWDDDTQRLKNRNYSTGETRVQQFGWSCVDNELASSTNNRCSSFKMEQAEILR